MLTYATATYEKVISHVLLWSPRIVYICGICKKLLLLSFLLSSSSFNINLNQSLHYVQGKESFFPPTFQIIPFCSFFFSYKIHLKSPEILCDIQLSHCFVLFKGCGVGEGGRGGELEPFISAAPRDQGG